MKTELTAGFDSPVLQSQSVFRTVMKAFSAPAKVFTMEKECEGPGNMYYTTASLALTLLDNDTKICVSQKINGSKDWLLFHCGAPFVEDSQLADFIIIAGADIAQPPRTYKYGSAEYPDASATIILEVESFTDGESFVATGPGIERENHFQVLGLTENWLELIGANKEMFPQGIDFILTSPDAILCLPRTTRLRSK